MPTITTLQAVEMSRPPLLPDPPPPPAVDPWPVWPGIPVGWHRSAFHRTWTRPSVRVTKH